MKSILVMGGTTFVSSSLAKYLIEQGYVVDILTRGLKSIDYEGVREHITCDRKSRNEVLEALKNKKYEFIFDISAYTKDDVEVLLNSIEKNKLKKYIFCSSGAVYKSSGDAVQEGFETGDNPTWGKYGTDKREAEAFIIKSGIPYIIFRPTYIYGEQNNLYREAYFFDRISNGEAIPMPFGKNIRTQFIHIEDLVRVFESAMNSTNVSKIYNVTNPEIVSWEELIEKCGEVVGKSPVIRKIDVSQIKMEPREYFPFRDVTYILDIKKLVEDGLYVPTISLEEGLSRAYEWYLNKKPNLNDMRMMRKVDELTDYR